MTSKMVANFRRSLSFPNHHSSKPRKPHHVRSTSLPCRSHPLISVLKDHNTLLKSWGSKPDTRTSAWLCDGLTRLKTIQDYLDDLLHLPQTHDSLRHHSDSIENLLEAFLRFIDVYGIFQTLVLALKQELSAAQVAIRRKDYSKLDCYLKAINKFGKEMSKLVSTVRSIGNSYAWVPDCDAQLAEAIGDVNELTVLVSVALFNGISSAFLSRKSTWMGMRLLNKRKRVKVEEGIEEFQLVGIESLLLGLRKKRHGGEEEEEVKMVLKRMHGLEDCIVGIEVCSERVFRSLINTRVSLLNVLTK
ncbi:unnamed protein product [Camellia sinensis]